MGAKREPVSDRNAERLETAKRLSSPSITCRPVVTIGSEKPEAEHIIRTPKERLGQALENAIVRGDFERVKKLVEEEGAIPLGKHVKIAMDMKEREIEDYLEGKIAERRSSFTPSMPSEKGWDDVYEKKED